MREKDFPALSFAMSPGERGKGWGALPLLAFGGGRGGGHSFSSPFTLGRTYVEIVLSSSLSGLALGKIRPVPSWVDIRIILT